MSEHRICGEDLMGLSLGNLAEMGITIMGRQKRMMRAIDALLMRA